MIIEPDHNSSKAGNHILVRAKHNTQRLNRIQPNLYSVSKKCLLQFILFWSERLLNFREFIYVRPATLSDSCKQLKFQKLITGVQIDLNSAYLLGKEILCCSPDEAVPPKIGSQSDSQRTPSSKLEYLLLENEVAKAY